MLIAVTVMPIAFDLLTKVPPLPGADPAGAPASASVTFLVIVAVSIFGARRWRLWSPLIGLVCGMAVAAAYGILDTGPLAAAAWIGLPALAWPGLDLSF